MADELSFRSVLPDTAAGRAAAFVLHHISTGGSELSAEDVDAVHGPPPPGQPPVDPAKFRDSYAGILKTLGGECALDEVVEATPTRLSAVIVGAANRRWGLEVEVAADAPYFVTNLSLKRAMPSGVQIRPAVPEDGPALREVSLRSPLTLGAAELIIDPGDDYFASMRLMGDDVHTYVATHHGAPIGVECGVSYPVRVGGRDGRFFLVARSRMLPEHAGTGAWSMLHTELSSRHYKLREVNMSSIAYVRPENASARRLSGMGSRWSTRVFRAVIDCARAAGPPAGRRSTPDDAARIAAVLNTFHGAEELYVPYTAETVSARLTRAADLYTWEDVLLGERAVVGVWDSGETQTMTVGEGLGFVSNRATVLDYGCEPGGEDELEDLLRGWCKVLAGAGLTHLGIFSSDPSPMSARLRELASTIEEFDVCPPYVREPRTAATNGVYVDPVYF